MFKNLLLLGMLLSLSVLRAQDEAIAFQYFNDGRFDKAAPYYEKLIKKNPSNLNYLNSLVVCYQQLQKPEQAEALLLEQLKSRSYSPLILVELGYNYQLWGKEKEAASAYDKALATIEENATYAYAIGNAFRAKALYEYAIKALQRGMQLDPNLNFDYDLAYLYGELGDLERMYSSYLDLLTDRANMKDQIKRNMGRFLYDESHPESNAILKRLLLKRAQEQPDVIWNELLSWLFVQQKDYPMALAQEKAVVKRSEAPQLEPVQDLGILALEGGDLETAEKAFEFVLEQAGSPSVELQAHLWLLETRSQMKGQSQEGILKQYREILEQYGMGGETADLQLAYARFLCFRSGRAEEAASFLTQALDEPMGRYELSRLRMALGDVLVYQEQFNRALIYYSQVQKEMKNHEMAQEARFKVARTSFFKGDFQWAETQLKVLKSSTSQRIANDALQLKLLISDHIHEDSTHVALSQYATASLRAFQGKDTEAITLFESLLLQHKGTPIEDEAWLELAGLQERNGMPGEAELNYQRIISFYPQGILTDDALFLLAQLYQKDLKTPEKARPLLERIIFEFEDSIYFPEARRQYRLLRGDVTGEGT